MAGPLAQPDNGIVLFYTEGPPSESLMGLKDPSVTSGELIIWWDDIEHTEGEYDWSKIDSDMAAWGAQGKKLDIRLSTVHLSPNTTPSWLYNKYNVRRIGRGVYTGFNSNKIAPYQILGGDKVEIPSSSGYLEKDYQLVSDSPGPLLSLVVTVPPQSRWSIQWDHQAFGQGEFKCEVFNQATGDLIETFSYDNADSPSTGFEFETGDVHQLELKWTVESGKWGIDNVNLLPIQENSPTRITDFRDPEDKHLAWKAGEEAVISLGGDQAGIRLSSDKEQDLQILRNDPDIYPIKYREGYLFDFELKALKESRVTFYLRSSRYPNAIDLKETIDLEPGQETTLRAYNWKLTPLRDGIAELVMEGPGDVLVREVRHRQWSERVTIFPDYFSPVFQEKWAGFIKAFAHRYRDNPTLGTVSVGGFGRWEEVMLDEDMHGLLDDQWVARGFTDENYLKLVEWSMNLYRSLLPDSPLRICLAYGLNDTNDVDWIYHRTAQEAAKRGIGLKQNGMSEKYDTWDSNTNTSYIYNRYRYDEDVKMTHETGGQIYRNTLNAHGHPISLLNRVLLNRTDFLFLYGPDVVGRHIRKYFHYATEQMGSSQITRFFCHLGDYTMVNEHSHQPVDYRNLWMGIRQVHDYRYKPGYVSIDGEKCIQTTPEQPRLLFDIDDRWQYEGMYGCELVIHYLDEGSKPFTVQVFDQSTRTWRTLGKVSRNNTNTWKTYTVYDSAWCRSPRNSGEDDHVDLILQSEDNSVLTVKLLELNFVPAKDWKIHTLIEEQRSTETTDLVSVASRSFQLTQAQAHGTALIEVPLSVPERIRTNLVGRLYHINEDSKHETLVSEKEYYMPADGDFFGLPFISHPNGGNYRLEIHTNQGEAGWILNDSGDPAIRIMSYTLTENVQLETSGEKVLEVGDSLVVTLDSDRPFAGFSLAMEENEVPPDPLEEIEEDTSVVSVMVYKKHADGSKSGPIAATDWFRLPEDGIAHYSMEPQLEGSYEIQITVRYGEVKVGLDSSSNAAVQPSRLTRRSTPRPSRTPLEASPQYSWSFGEEAQEMKVLSTDAFEQFDYTDTMIKAKLKSNNARITTPDSLAIPSEKTHELAFSLKNETRSSMLKVEWETEENSPENIRSVYIPVVPNDNVLRRYTYPVGIEPGWTGKIQEIAFLITSGTVDRGTIEFGDVSLNHTPVLLDLKFEASPDSFEILSGVESYERINGSWRLELDGEDVPVIQVPKKDFTFEVEPGQVLEIRMKNSTSGKTARFKWYWLGHPTVPYRTSIRETSELSFSFPISSHDNDFQTYRFNLDEYDGWEGHIVALGLNPIDEEGIKGTVEIDSVRIYNPSVMKEEEAK